MQQNQFLNILPQFNFKLDIRSKLWIFFISLGFLILHPPLTNFSKADIIPPTYLDGDLRIIPRTAEEAKRIRKVLKLGSNFSKPEKFEYMSAGAASTRRRATSHTFSDPSASISFAKELEFKIGNGFFKKLWVSSPSSTLASDGLGPLFNSRSCQSCHIKDGRGHPPANSADSRNSMILGLYQFTGQEETDKGTVFQTVADPNYGSQLQDLSVAGIHAEGKLQILYRDLKRNTEDKNPTSLRYPTYKAAGLNYGPLDSDTSISARVAPQMIGLGLLEAIPSNDIIALADPHDLNDDGISGIARMVYSDEHEQFLLGRFGYKADAPTIRQQSAKAMHTDMGLSNPLYPTQWGDCSDAQETCIYAPHGGDEMRDGFEVDEEGLKLLTFYSRNLGVPKRVNIDDPAILDGKSLFYGAGCASCHQPKFVTHRLVDQPEQSFQLIWPYSDMLLHDMGEDLADQGASNPLTREWRTAPLWGIGMTEQVSGHSYFLHDGRAQNLSEAILWHGGEAQTSRDKFAAMEKNEKRNLLSFLRSL